MSRKSGRNAISAKSIDNILDVSKIEGRKVTLEAVSFNLRDTVEDLIQLLRVQASVSDTGIGIGADQATTLFAPFIQAEASTTRKYGETGLGLAICKQLVEMMGGTIGVHSREGQGSSFWFTAVFELAPSHPRQFASEPCRRPAQPVQTLPARTARILVAEDEVIRCFRELCDAYLMKPIDLSKLLYHMKSYRLVQ